MCVCAEIGKLSEKGEWKEKRNGRSCWENEMKERNRSIDHSASTLIVEETPFAEFCCVGRGESSKNMAIACTKTFLMLFSWPHAESIDTEMESEIFKRGCRSESANSTKTGETPGWMAQKHISAPRGTAHMPSSRICKRIPCRDSVRDSGHWCGNKQN